MNMNEKRRVPGFTAEQALEQGATTPYAVRAVGSSEGGAVEPALTVCRRLCYPGLGCLWECHTLQV
jgi:hypothetical protein